jgi:malic enzyme
MLYRTSEWISTNAVFLPVTVRMERDLGFVSVNSPMTGYPTDVCRVDDIFPGLGLGALLSRARRITDHMIAAAAQAVTGLTDTTTQGAPLLPPIDDLRTTSAQIALAVAQAAAHDGVAGLPGITAEAVSAAMWQPRYVPVHAV